MIFILTKCLKWYSFDRMFKIVLIFAIHDLFGPFLLRRLNH